MKKLLKDNLNIELLVGSMTKKEKSLVIERLLNNEIDFILDSEKYLEAKNKTKSIKTKKKKVSKRQNTSSKFDLKTFFIVIFFSGVHGGADTHVPFPNTVVKGSSGDGTVNLTMGE